jgi:protein tyrosine/serine phosphatase
MSRLNRELGVDWVDLSGVPGLREAKGRLGMTLLPGRQGSGWSGDHRRDLDEDAGTLRDVHQANVLLLLVEDHELEQQKVTNIVAVMGQHGIEVIRHPIKDLGVPADPAAYRAVLDDLRARVADGDNVVVACRGGLGRTGTAVACMLVDSGLDAEAAIKLTRASRKGTIESAVQEDFIRGWRARSPRPR